MKKLLRIAAGIACLFALTMLSACNYDNLAGYDNQPYANTEPDTPEDIEPSYDEAAAAGILEAPDAPDALTYWQGLQMYVVTDSVTPTGLGLSMINSSDLYFGHGVMFDIQQYVNGQWQQVPFINDAFWVLPLLIVAPNTTVDENISWEHLHGELPPGQYRIVRNFSVEDMHTSEPAWQREIPSADLYATFTVHEDWQAGHDRWLSGQEDLAAIAYARFKGLDIEILEYSPRGLSFTLTNNNPYYSYIISSIFVGWEDNFPDGGFAGSLEYFIFADWNPEGSGWPFGGDVRLSPGEYLAHEVYWYDEIGYLTPGMRRDGPNPNLFEVVADVLLDVSEGYVYENFRHMIPGLPGVGHRIRAEFDLSHFR